MTDPVTVGLILTVLLILAVVVALLFTSTPVKRRPPHGAVAALHRHLLGDREGARAILHETIKGPDAPVEAFLHLGDILRADGEATRALALHRGILARPRLTPELRRLTELAIADDLLALHREDEAQQRLAELDDHFHDEALLQRRALALHRLGRQEEAAEVWIRRAKLDRARHGRAAGAYLAELAREHLRAGRLDAAERHARRARELDPEVAAAAAVLGDVLLQRGQAEKAGEVWAEGLRTAKGAGAQILPRLLDLSHRSGKMESLLPRLEAVREERPDDPSLWRAVADLRLRRGDVESFFALIEDAPEEGADELAAWAGWLRHLRAKGDDAALARLLRALPDSFGPKRWVCPKCGHEDPEARQACMHCGRPVALRAVSTDEAAALAPGQVSALLAGEAR